ncbi:NAD-dependent epimerase/dehydratase family protein [Sulfitobacter mediterraneus]|uniref:NAD-dependent epimerase/dehydratase family protein n=1 Tax=Sulfitobacter mediterraneus TaxID=83219 RepID=UPI0021A30CE0|nr:NAD-dependent epimerase/dehydratase family protein [Sulfitobacter mediterraneus]
MGGTGHIGAAIARRLAEAGYRVTATGRSDKPRPNLAGTEVRIAVGQDALPMIAGMDLVVDAATPYPVALHGRDTAGRTKQAVLRSKALLDAAKQADAAFVHISSFTTLPRPNPSALSQIGQGVLRGMHDYFDVKQRVEDSVRRALEQGLRGCIVNPATCFGPYDLKPKEQAFVPMLLGGQVRGLVRHDLNVVDVRDVADIVLACAAQGFPHVQVPVFGHTVSLRDLATQICAITGAAPPRLEVPSLMGLAGLYWMETAFALTGRQSPWPSLPMMLVSASYAATPTAQQLDLHPNLRPLPQTLQDAVQWYQQVGAV